MISAAKADVLPSLTGLRFIAAYCILFAHHTVPLQYDLWGLHILPSVTAVIGMPLFFILSGFVIHYNYGQSLSRLNGSAAYEFIVARFSRIYPLFAAILVFYLLHDGMLFAWRKQGDIGALLPIYLSGLFSWWPVYSGKQLLIEAPYGISWSISTEFFFYFAYIFFAQFIFALGTLKAAARFFIACLALGYAIHAIESFSAVMDAVDRLGSAAHTVAADWPNSTYRWLFYVSPYSRIFEFLLGCATAQLFIVARAVPLSSRLLRVLPSVLCGCIGLLFVGLILVFDAYPNWLNSAAPWWARYFARLHMSFLFALFIAPLLLVLALRDDRLAGRRFWLNSKLFVMLGELSLSLYLLHPIALRIVPIAQGDRFYVLAKIFFGGIVTIMLAKGTYELIEVPARRYLRGKLSRRHAGA